MLFHLNAFVFALQKLSRLLYIGGVGACPHMYGLDTTALKNNSFVGRAFSSLRCTEVLTNTKSHQCPLSFQFRVRPTWRELEVPLFGGQKTGRLRLLPRKRPFENHTVELQIKE